MGSSGSGKTTLLNIFLGLLEPTSGEVYLNKESKMKYNTLSTFSSYMPQGCFILENSIKVNICLENNDLKIDNNKLNDALRFFFRE